MNTFNDELLFFSLFPILFTFVYIYIFDFSSLFPTAPRPSHLLIHATSCVLSLSLSNKSKKPNQPNREQKMKIKANKQKPNKTKNIAKTKTLWHLFCAGQPLLNIRPVLECGWQSSPGMLHWRNLILTSPSQCVDLSDLTLCGSFVCCQSLCELNACAHQSYCVFKVTGENLDCGLCLWWLSLAVLH